jgi:hypothetical protein
MLGFCSFMQGSSSPSKLVFSLAIPFSSSKITGPCLLDA